MGLYIKNMQKPKKGEVIAFDGENAVYTDDDMKVHKYPLIEIDLIRCGECAWYEKPHCRWHNIDNKPTDFCSYGERSNE